MDAGLLNFHENEQFPPLTDTYFMDLSGDECINMQDDTDNNYSWDWDCVGQLNENMALTSEIQMSSSPPFREEELKEDWKNILDLNVQINSASVHSNEKSKLNNINELSFCSNELNTSLPQEDFALLEDVIRESDVEKINEKTYNLIVEKTIKEKDYDLDKKNEGEDALLPLADGSFDLPTFICQSDEIPLDCNSIDNNKDEEYSLRNGSNITKCETLGSSSTNFLNKINSDISDDILLCNITSNDIKLKNDIRNHNIASSIEVGNNNVTSNVITNIPKPKTIGPGGKKIDMKAGRYVIEETKFSDSEDDEVDVETISECGTSPVLEARDLDSLLEQFEAETISDNPSENKIIPNHINQRDTKKTLRIKNDKSKQKRISEDLLQRMKESGKKKSVMVIEPIRTKKRGRPSYEENSQKGKIAKVNKMKKEAEKINTSGKIKLQELSHVIIIKKEHDYCQEPGTILKYAKNYYDSEEEDVYKVGKLIVESTQDDVNKFDLIYSKQQLKTCIIRNQPAVKNADGKLMVSLLKTNTIKNNANNEMNVKQKKKLNLEEYKKRRDISVKSTSTTPSSSCQSSPKRDTEDEQTRRQKHQELLMKMASEVLKAKKKDGSQSGLSSEIKEAQEIKTQQISLPTVVKTITPPLNLEKKILVTTGTNTDETWEVHGRLDEIKPLLKNASVKINSNSLINSLIENIPKISCKKKLIKRDTQEEVYRENKTIVYLDKNRPLIETKSVFIQTDNSWLIDNVDKYSCSEDEGRLSRSSSTHSRSTSRSSRSPSSRSPSPVRRRKYKSRSKERERMNEVEERRVIYVGRISSSTTKEDLRLRFEPFGPITNVSVHYRTVGDNYGFVTFKKKQDAYNALEHGNDDPSYPRVDLSFGGRRMFCKTHYSDLDDMREDSDYYTSPYNQEVSFEYLLKDFQKLRKRKL